MGEVVTFLSVVVDSEGLGVARGCTRQAPPVARACTRPAPPPTPPTAAEFAFPSLATPREAAVAASSLGNLPLWSTVARRGGTVAATCVCACACASGELGDWGSE